MNASSIASLSPLVSVIIPAYNAEKFIERTLCSVLTQTYHNIEVIVVDDGSHDRTSEIVKGLAQEDSRVTLLQQQNAGVAAARNIAIQYAKGEFIAPIDADDIWYPENLAKQIYCFQQSDASVGVVYSWSFDIDEADLPIVGYYHAATVEGNVFSTLLCHNFIGNASATLIRHTCLDVVGGYHSYFREMNVQGCEDWDLYLRLAEKYQFRAVSSFLVGYRKVTSSMSRDYDKMARSHDLMLQLTLERQSNIPYKLFGLSRSSFYLYLAYQSRQCHCYLGVLYWLFQMLRADYIVSLLRPGLYQLVLESIVRLTVKDISLLIKGTENCYWKLLKVLLKNTHKSISAALPATFKKDIKVKLKVWIGNRLHRSVSVATHKDKIKFHSSSIT